MIPSHVVATRNGEYVRIAIQTSRGLRAFEFHETELDDVADILRTAKSLFAQKSKARDGRPGLVTNQLVRS